MLCMWEIIPVGDIGDFSSLNLSVKFSNLHVKIRYCLIFFLMLLYLIRFMVSMHCLPAEALVRQKYIVEVGGRKI